MPDFSQARGPPAPNCNSDKDGLIFAEKNERGTDPDSNASFEYMALEDGVNV